MGGWATVFMGIAADIILKLRVELESALSALGMTFYALRASPSLRCL